MLLGAARKVLMAEFMLDACVISVALHTPFGEHSIFEQDVGAEAGHDKSEQIKSPS
jgi:hypothetical protein